jgi:hypothetical protein
MHLVRSSILIIFLIGALSSAQPNQYPMFPNPQLTPGDILTTDANIVCVKGYSATVRKVSESLKRTVYLSYGIVKKPGEEFEVDHLIALELGGSNDIKNLWIESGTTQPLNFHTKDKLENAIHDLVCAGQMSLEEAQQKMASNWAKLYKEYLGNLKNGIDPSTISENPNQISAQTVTPVTTPLNSISSAHGIPPSPNGQCPPETPIKGSKNGLYHLPGSTYYTRTNAVICFDSEAHAKAAGYKKPEK